MCATRNKYSCYLSVSLSRSLSRSVCVHLSSSYVNLLVAGHRGVCYCGIEPDVCSLTHMATIQTMNGLPWWAHGQLTFVFWAGAARLPDKPYRYRTDADSSETPLTRCLNTWYFSECCSILLIALMLRPGRSSAKLDHPVRCGC